MNIMELFPDKFVVDPTTGCWLFTGGLTEKGYGKVRYKYHVVSIHRLSAYLSLELDINDKSIHALHKKECPHKNCGNPEHIYLGDNTDNIRDAVGKHYSPRKFITHCKYGHPLSGDNLYISPTDGRRRCNTCRRRNTKRHEETHPSIRYKMDKT